MRIRSVSAVVLVLFVGMLVMAAPPVWGGESGAYRAGSVRVGDIDVGYRIMGEGYPVVLITGYSAVMEMWDPLIVKELSYRYKVILFDNRGMGRTTATDKPFSIELFAEDVKGLMDALQIRKAHVLGWSMGTFIAQELALRYPERVDKLMLYAGTCGHAGDAVVKPRPEVIRDLTDPSGTGEERGKRLVSILFPKKWLEEHPDFLKDVPRPESVPSKDILERQGKAIGAWGGVCARLGEIRQPTLVITGTEDVVIPPGNSLAMASRIPASWLVRIPGGHSNMYQYPVTFSRCLLTFLDAETK